MMPRPILAATFLVACATGAPPAVEPVATRRAAEPAFTGLSVVPADTPYALAVLDPMPWASLERALPEAWRSHAFRPQVGPRPEDPDDVLAQLFWAYQVDAARSFDEARARGVGDGARLVIYGLGVYPALRAEVDDAAAVRATIDRVIATADVEVESFEVGGLDVLLVPMDFEASLVVAFPSGHELAVGLFPDDEVEPLTRALLGVDRPARSLADTGRLDAIVRDHGISRHGVAFVDTRRLLAALPFELLPECDHDLTFLAALVPELVAGYERFDEHGMAVVARLVTHPQIARALTALRASVPGLTETPEGDPLLVAGLGVDLGAARALVDDARDALRVQPLRCEVLRPIGEAIATLDDALVKVPRELDVIHGVQVTIDELAIADGPTRQVRVRARAAIAADDPELLLYQASPALNDGVAVVEASAKAPAELSLARLGIPGVDRVMVAVDARAIAISADPDRDTAAAALPSVLDGARPTEPPLAVIAFDFARLTRLVGEAPTLALGWGLMSLSLHADARGVAVRMTASFE
jgi:hypothetical protein